MSEILDAEYVYITIPKDYIHLYHRIMTLMADYGEAKLKDCTAECLRNNQLVINAFNVFNAAIGALNNHRETLAETLFKYVNATIDNLYKGLEEEPQFIYESDIDGKVIIDIENNKIICEDGEYSIGGEITQDIHYDSETNSLVINSDTISLTNNSLII
jgi:hypothetical protein